MSKHTKTAPAAEAPGHGQGDEDEDQRPVTVEDLDDPNYGLRGSLWKVRAIAVFAGAADLQELVLNEPDKETLAQLMAVIIEQLDAGERVLDDYLEAERARRKGTTSP